MNSKIRTKIFFLFLLLLLISTPILSAKTIRVPTDYPTIKKAIAMARDGDVVEVKDGIYLEENIIIDKNIHVKAENLYGAIIEGASDARNSIFIVRAETEIEGFILLNAGNGILQRDSPDVNWTAHDIVIINMILSGISINDRENRVGFANLSNIIVDDCFDAFVTNDARGFNIQNCLITNCEIAFNGSNHDSFFIDNSSIFHCNELSFEDSNLSSPFLNNELEFGPNIFLLDYLLEGMQLSDFSSTYDQIFENIEPGVLENIENSGNLKSISFNIFGEIYYKLKRYDIAAEWFEKSLVLGEKLNNPEINTYAYFNLARLKEDQGDFLEANDLYKKSINELDKVRTDIPLTDQRVSFLRSKIDIYESFINLLLKQQKRDPLGGFSEEAFYFVEKSKARSFIESLEESNINLEIQINPELSAWKRVVLERMAELQYQLNRQKLEPKERQVLLDELIKTESDYKSVMIQIKKENPQYADLLIPLPFSYSEIQETLLDRETALLEYFVGEQYSFAFLITLKGLFVSRIPDSPTLTRLIDNYLLFLTLNKTGSFNGGPGGKRLFDLIIGPFSEQIGKNVNKLIIVPDSCLNHLPFESLVKDSKYLVYDYDLSYAASASLLINLSETKNSEDNKMDFLGIANPRFQDKKLHFVQKEIKTISRLFNKKRTRLLFNKKATERNFKSSNLSNYKIIHLAMHGNINDEFWWRSALFFFPVKDNQEDGLLQPIDISNIELNSDLVVLSACQTGKGKIEKAEGILGFTRAFINAGAESVLASLWEIDDKTTPLFMKYFYTYLEEGAVKSKALQLAKIQMIESGFDHPFYWAPFILFGKTNTSIDF